MLALAAATQSLDLIKGWHSTEQQYYSNAGKEVPDCEMFAVSPF